MHAFDFCLYAAALITVLLLRAEPAATAAPVQPAPVEVVEPTPAPVPAMAAAAAAPVAIARVEVAPLPATDYAAMTSAQLRQECQRRCISWRNAHGKGKHMLKGEMLKALT